MASAVARNDAPQAPTASVSRSGPRQSHAPQSRQPDLQRILGLTVPVCVVLAECDMRIEAILNIKVGTIIEFDVPFDSDLGLVAANREIGSGQAVKVGENFGLRVSSIGTVRERINALGGAEPDD